jgi:tetratricopeptide (TPR) repeat protein
LREARELITDVEAGISEQADQLDAIGTLLTHCGDPRSALQFFARAVQSKPESVPYRYNLAMAQRMTGDLTAAEVNLNSVLAVDPSDGEAQLARSGLRKQTSSRNHVAELKNALSRSHGQPKTNGLLFALAKELEDLGAYQAAYAHVQAGCLRVRRALQYDVSADLDVITELCSSHTAPVLAAKQSQVPDRDPIFIVGLPRSGTTLLERILGCHPQVTALGELDTFPSLAIQAVTERCAGAVPKHRFVKESLSIDFEWLGREYLSRVHAQPNCSTARFSDKLPFNYLYAGLISCALPNARFLAVRRHPLDTCFAMYKTLFAAAYPFSYDLGDLARYYVAWDALMRHWAENLGASWHEVSYEDLVQSPHATVRRALEHCKLPWDENCLKFHNSASPVATASAVQVRQPLYTESVGKWRSYAKELEPLASYLRQHGINFSN